MANALGVSFFMKLACSYSFQIFAHKHVNRNMFILYVQYALDSHWSEITVVLDCSNSRAPLHCILRVVDVS